MKDSKTPKYLILAFEGYKYGLKFLFYKLLDEKFSIFPFKNLHKIGKKINKSKYHAKKRKFFQPIEELLEKFPFKEVKEHKNP
ncbi:MAG: hypothetical protein GF311_00575 [Candidatus Lokiarchaeota archaeon]|nr:hypothetical protein [Candidatus Lokiarchaeota archaeon]